MKKIALAGGCFWGIDEFFSRKEGVLYTKSGYSNGDVENPTYEQVCSGNTGHAETVYIEYDENQITLNEILEKFFKVIDPTTLNKQGNDTTWLSIIYVKKVLHEIFLYVHISLH